MRRATLLVDIALALAVTMLVLILGPGLAVVALLAVAVLGVCAASFLIGGWRRRRARGRSSRRRTVARR